MKLVICAQDIRSITFGLFDEGVVRQEVVKDSSPEDYLASLKEVMSDLSFGLNDLSGVFVVTGPGSFTSSRVSTTIANTIAFTKNIPIMGLENPERLSLGDLLNEVEFSGQDSVVPSYDRPPNITTKKEKDI